MIGVAAFSLLMDFDMADQAVRADQVQVDLGGEPLAHDVHRGPRVRHRRAR